MGSHVNENETRGPWFLTLCLITLTEAEIALSQYDKQMYQITSKNIKCYKVSHPIYVLLVSKSLNLVQFCSVNGNFETSTLYDPKVTLTKVPQINMTTAPEF